MLKRSLSLGAPQTISWNLHLSQGIAFDAPLTALERLCGFVFRILQLRNAIRFGIHVDSSIFVGKIAFSSAQRPVRK
jgi:hypothetical protein